jgi:hypothetical protein
MYQLSVSFNSVRGGSEFKNWNDARTFIGAPKKCGQDEPIALQEQAGGRKPMRTVNPREGFLFTGWRNAPSHSCSAVAKL